MSVARHLTSNGPLSAGRLMQVTLVYTSTDPREARITSVNSQNRVRLVTVSALLMYAVDIHLLYRSIVTRQLLFGYSGLKLQL